MIKFDSSLVLSIPLALTLALFSGCGENGQEAQPTDDIAPATEPAEPEAPQAQESIPAGDGAEAQPTNQWPPLHLQQVVPGERAAVIDGEVIYEGDQVEGITLREVERDGVILQRGTHIVFLARGQTLQPDPEEEITGTEDEISAREGDITGAEEIPSREGDVTGSEEETADGEY